MRSHDAKADFPELSSNMKLQKEPVSFEGAHVSESEPPPLSPLDDSMFNTLPEIVDSKQPTTEEDLDKHDSSLSFEGARVSESEPPLSLFDDGVFKTFLEIVDSKQQPTTEEDLDKHDSSLVFDGSAPASPLLSKKPDRGASLRLDSPKWLCSPTGSHEDAGFNLDRGESLDNHGDSPFVSNGPAFLTGNPKKLGYPGTSLFLPIPMHEIGFSLGRDDAGHRLDKDISDDPAFVYQQSQKASW